ncbi:hypothetical protein [Streptomyces sp. NPDC058739]|uniref:hypothetical protein n=1 Tax=Streptomyces sp. NPDC058739 TaxID=3346618 RepID=UPI0036D19DAB
MSTGLIIALIVIGAVLVVAVAALMALRYGRSHGGGDLRKRFGPEYDRAVTRHDGDTKAAERDLARRVARHGDLRVEPLDPERQERFQARWAAAQERFVDAPREALSEADHLLGEAAEARGFPDSGHYDEQLAALSVHHARHVQGYRHVHRLAHAPEHAAGHAPEQPATAGHGPAGDGVSGNGAATEEMRTAMIEARELFQDLVGAGAVGSGTKGSRVI